ncbi:MAG: TIGR03936 family radical SAM-associated protein, partial [Elusimicrobiota bacterium]|nr:TIGR03936 family radical SAM-associated protein [Elusimicrobiota bacterium]
DFYVHRQSDVDEVFAWDHLHFGTDKKDLLADWIKGINETDEPSQSINKDCSNFPENLTTEKSDNVSITKVRLRFSKKGTGKFISHMEQVDVFRRAIRRSGIPATWSGSNYRQLKASYSPPLPLGYESVSEYIDLNMTKKMPLLEIKEAVEKNLPQQFKLLDVKHAPLSFPSLVSLANLAEYTVEGSGATQDDIDRLWGCDTIMVKKIKLNKTLDFDAKPFIKEIKIENAQLKLLIYLNQAKTVKPDLILKALLPNKNPAAFLIERSGLFIETRDGIRHML